MRRRAASSLDFIDDGLVRVGLTSPQELWLPRKSHCGRADQALRALFQALSLATAVSKGGRPAGCAPREFPWVRDSRKGPVVSAAGTLLGLWQPVAGGGGSHPRLSGPVWIRWSYSVKGAPV